MTTDLIPINTNPNGKQTVNARDLHEFLEVGKDFSTWIKNKIKKYDLEENQEFIVFPQMGENPQGGRPATEYHLTIDTAKELSMLQNNEKGKQARRYFIECERRAKGGDLTPAEQLLRQAKMLVVVEREQIRIAMEQKALEGRQVESETRLSRIEARLHDDPGYFAITGYANLMGMAISEAEAKSLGKQATNLSKELGVAISKVRHTRWGLVNAYHESILHRVMAG